MENVERSIVADASLTGLYTLQRIKDLCTPYWLDKKWNFLGRIPLDITVADSDINQQGLMCCVDNGVLYTWKYGAVQGRRAFWIPITVNPLLTYSMYLAIQKDASVEREYKLRDILKEDGGTEERELFVMPVESGKVELTAVLNKWAKMDKSLLIYSQHKDFWCVSYKGLFYYIDFRNKQIMHRFDCYTADTDKILLSTQRMEFEAVLFAEFLTHLCLVLKFLWRDVFLKSWLTLFPDDKGSALVKEMEEVDYGFTG